MTFWNSETQVELSLERTALTLTLPEAVPDVRLGTSNTNPDLLTLASQAVVLLVVEVVVFLQSAVPVGLGKTALLPRRTVCGSANALSVGKCMLTLTCDEPLAIENGTLLPPAVILPDRPPV